MKNKKGSIWIGMGLLFIVAALCLCGYNLWDAKRAEKAVGEVLQSFEIEKKEYAPADPETGEYEVPDYVLNPQMQMPTQKHGDYHYIGMLELPACDLKLPVISEWTYPALKIAPCRFSGTPYLGNMMIAAHSYEAHFRKIRTIPMGEIVIFTDMDGNVFQYEIIDRENVSGTDLNALQGGDWDLTLFTCTPGGSSRVAVRCEMIHHN